MWDAFLHTQSIAWPLGHEQRGTEQHSQREAWLAVLQCQPSSSTSLLASLNPFNMLKKKGKPNFPLLCEQSHHVSSTSTLGPLYTNMQEWGQCPTREAWAFKSYTARRH